MGIEWKILFEFFQQMLWFFTFLVYHNFNHHFWMFSRSFFSDCTQLLSLLLGNLKLLTHGQDPRHVTNTAVRQTTCCFPVSHLIREVVLLFGHVACLCLNRINIGSLGHFSDHPAIGEDLVDCCTSWLRGIDSDIQSVNIVIQSAWRKASVHILWRRIVDMATLRCGARHWRTFFLE